MKLGTLVVLIISMYIAGLFAIAAYIFPVYGIIVKGYQVGEEVFKMQIAVIAWITAIFTIAWSVISGILIDRNKKY